MFKKAGFPEAVPICFWNLRSSGSVPVKSKDSRGVTLLSGFSAGLLKSFLSGNLEEFTPSAQLAAIVDLPAYANLRVVLEEV